MLHHLKSFVDRKIGITHRETWTEAEVLDIIRENQIQPAVTFSYNRMDKPVTDAAKLAGWEADFIRHLRGLEAYPEYEEKAKSLKIFQERLAQFGFQQARQVVVVGTEI